MSKIAIIGAMQFLRSLGLAASMVLAAVLCFATGNISGATVFQTSGSTGPYSPGPNGYVGVGDDVTLAGTERFLQNLTVTLGYSFDSTHTAYTPNLQITLSQPNGGIPGATIYTGTATGATLIGLNGSQTEAVTFALPLVQVPTSFDYVISQVGSNFDSNTFFVVAQGVSTGSSGIDLIGFNGTNYGSIHVVDANNNSYPAFSATINAVAVPEPSAWMLLFAGGMLALPLRRKMLKR